MTPKKPIKVAMETFRNKTMRGKNIVFPEQPIDSQKLLDRQAFSESTCYETRTCYEITFCFETTDLFRNNSDDSS
jgi:hypothetical protein